MMADRWAWRLGNVQQIAVEMLDEAPDGVTAGMPWFDADDEDPTPAQWGELVAAMAALGVDVSWHPCVSEQMWHIRLRPMAKAAG
jgi:hypothetical protein